MVCSLSGRKKPRLFLALCLLSVASGVMSKSFQLGERLSYTVSYSGILSAWQPVNIASAVLEIDPQLQNINGETVISAHLMVSTEAYAMAERFYPIRYTFKSWFEPTARYVVMDDEMRSEKGFNQTLLWFDQNDKEVQRFKRSDDRMAKNEVLPPFLRQQYKSKETAPSGFRKKGGVELTLGMMDHLTLLYRMRLQRLKIGKVVELPASDGKDMTGYRVEVLGEERLSRATESQMTMKVKFVPQDRDEGDLDAIYVWYALDKARTPVRFYSGRDFGNIEITLDGKHPGLRWQGEREIQPTKKFNILDLDS